MLDQLEEDLLNALKNKEKDKLITLRGLKASLKQQQIDNKRELTEDLLIEVISKQLKMLQDSIVEFEKGNREDLIEKTNKEIELLKHYLPKQLEDNEILSIIDEIFLEVKPQGVKDMGKIMPLAKERFKGIADMKKVSNLIKEKLK